MTSQIRTLSIASFVAWPSLTILILNIWKKWKYLRFCGTASLFTEDHEIWQATITAITQITWFIFVFFLIHSLTFILNSIKTRKDLIIGKTYNQATLTKPTQTQRLRWSRKHLVFYSPASLLIYTASYHCTIQCDINCNRIVFRIEHGLTRSSSLTAIFDK